MANACDTCGYRSSDIKAGGGISEKGSSITLQVSEPEDLRRDVIKADTASIVVPEADLEVTTGWLAHTAIYLVLLFGTDWRLAQSLFGPYCR